ncbi:MAG: polysaccharide deacetylase family protein [Pirellulales bacterium]
MTRKPILRSVRLILCGLSCLLPALAARGETWAEKLGYPSDKVVLILHADDVGMCYEANQAAKDYLTAGRIQSAAMMVPCPWFNEIADWYKEHPEYDMGLHLAMNSEWRWYRWGPVAGKDKVPGMVDKDGYLWRDVPDTATHATGEEIEAEIRAQLERAISRGIRPSHIDTHMGTLYARIDYTRAYLKVAQEYRIPAMAIEMTPPVVAKFRKQGYPITDESIKELAAYTLPKLDDFHAAPNAKTYEEKKENFFELVRSMSPGLNEVIFHPSIPTEGLKHITGSWQQRVWESQMFADPAMLAFFEREGVLFTNWKEMMQRFEKRVPAGAGK